MGTQKKGLNEHPKHIFKLIDKIYAKQYVDIKMAIHVFGASNTSLKDVKCISDFFCFVALRPKSTAMVIAGRSVHLTTLFPGQA